MDRLRLPHLPGNNASQSGGRPRFRTGTTIIYISVLMVTMMAFASLAVDYGRAQMAKTQLRHAADAAARYGATGFANNTINANAIAAAAQNYVDGSPLVLQAGDITTITWNAGSGTITAGNPSPNAVQVTARRVNSRGTGIPLLFMGMLGRRTVDISATSIASYVAAVNTTLVAPSSGNPWLAGMPNGTTGNTYDSAPANSPAQVTSISITPGTKLRFSFTGSASYYPGTQPFDPDGNPDWIINNYTGNEHGKSNLYAPLTSVVGVFLTNQNPASAGAVPATLDFSTPASRDFSSLSPALRQPFFIGNGKREDGTTLQEFVVPVGATRFYLGIMDGQQWSDNAGSLTASIVQPAQITTVK